MKAMFASFFLFCYFYLAEHPQPKDKFKEENISYNVHKK